MNKNSIFKLLGALSAGLIIVSVFVPFVSSNGYTQSLWDSYSSMEQLYLPIILLIMGISAVVFISLNIKSELAYISAGGGLFFAVTEAFLAMNNKSFESLSIGYYCLLIGSVLTAIFAFLLNMKKNDSVDKTVIQEQPQTNNVFAQMDNLYNNQQDLSNGIQPIEPIKPINEELGEIQSLNQIDNSSVMNASIPNVEQGIQPMVESIPDVTQNEGPVVETTMPEMVSGNNSSLENTVQSNIVEPNLTPVQPVQANPVLAEFNQPIMNNNVAGLNVQPNLEQPSTTSFFGSPSSTTTNNESLVQNNTVPSETQTDIFGQPLN